MKAFKLLAGNNVAVANYLPLAFLRGIEVESSICCLLGAANGFFACIVYRQRAYMPGLRRRKRRLYLFVT
jgi:hypothetical protein